MAATAGIHCSYFVARKRRYCKLSPAIGKIYCGEHAHLDKDAQAESNRKRIQCPLDPKHSIYEDQLKHHLTKCNSREKNKPIYYEKNLNSGSEDSDFDLKVTLSSMSNFRVEIYHGTYQDNLH
ncbi:tRNA:m(4)X modification enzyme TRM13 homolog, partial [Saccoglossus kowalevskii]|uniref:tRNA:m(4)X modification enzyme TRM13 n=1 Tax=Saccoglossus kowalevskii TaxID=10224 RepID=A0ABM0M1N1_SACKO